MRRATPKSRRRRRRRRCLLRSARRPCVAGSDDLSRVSGGALTPTAGACLDGHEETMTAELWVGDELGESWALRRFIECVEWTALQVVVEERSRGPFDDPELRLLVGVRRKVRSAEQPQQELRASCKPEEGGARSGGVDRIRRPLNGEERRAVPRKRAHAGQRGAREHDRGIYAVVPEPVVIGDGERGFRS